MPIGQPPRPRRVLVVDDYAPFRRATARKLALENYEVFEASNGPQALHLARQRELGAILLDLKLGPPLNGIDVLQRLRADAATAGVPIVAISGLASPEEQARALSGGAADFLEKGDQDTMCRSLEKLLEARLPSADVVYLDDDDEWAALVQQWLRRRGLSVHRLRSPSEWRTYMAAPRALPRCLVLDVALGQGEDGFSVCNHVKRSPALQSLPLVILTSRPVSLLECLKHQALYRVEKRQAAEVELPAVLDNVLIQQDRTNGVIDAGDVRVDPRSGIVLFGGKALGLRDGLLSAFVKVLCASPESLSEDELYASFLSRGSYQRRFDQASHRPVLHNYVSQLRKALGPVLGGRVVCTSDHRYAYERVER